MKLADILDTLSHDLKSPIVKIKSQIIIAQHTNASATAMKDRLDEIDMLLSRLNTHLNSVFEGLSVMAGNSPFLYEFFDTKTLASELKALSSIPALSIQFPDESIVLLADKENIIKAITLCTQSLRYKNPDLPVHIICSGGKNKIILDIQAPSVLAESIRADAGLFLAYQIVTGHGGSLEQINKPSGLRIVLPVKAKRRK